MTRQIKIKAVIFGMMGVIYDSTPFTWQARNQYLARFGVTISPTERLGLLGHPLTYQLEVINQKYNLSIDYDDFSNETRKIQLELMKDSLKPVAGLPEFLADLQKHQIKTAIASFNLRKFIDEDLAVMQLQDKFDVIVSAEDVSQKKPHPEILLKTAAKLGVKPEECIFIDDAATGIETARNAGMKCIIRKTVLEKQVPDMVIENFVGLTLPKLEDLS